ncbi:hypothetical protein JC525_18540 [Alteromonas sp. IB21]|uniref:DUF6768 family protein n=1 Tax=Alteromonas sp. IB21 TaxID=2779369 RepID=UPI0018E84B85|nr:DUF6768 family protein [Alteromonas sp. IB21]MBJ2130929.1 hypothetical protein [Alteromonas sp. IB21]
MKKQEKFDKEVHRQKKVKQHDVQNAGLINYLRMGFASDFPVIMKLGYAMAIIFSVLIFYSGYHFFTADKDSELFWGVCLVLSVNAQITVKLWIYMQTNHNIVMHELLGMKNLSTHR